MQLSANRTNVGKRKPGDESRKSDDAFDDGDVSLGFDSTRKSTVRRAARSTRQAHERASERASEPS